MRQVLLQPIPGIEDALTSLGRTHRLWLTTNGVPAHQRQKLQATHLTAAFDRVFVSGDVGAPKADPRFVAALRRALRGAQVCQVVGDSVTQDLQLAANGGWAATHICQPATCTAAPSPAPVAHTSSVAGMRCAC
ncbi:HAD family hydrolase [Actinoplanes philippinensis]|uniref:HAD family hydrolase n=1 Tax=Actinoplanes philippinensis TaxID=35752 RepID=UPI0033C407BB